MAIEFLARLEPRSDPNELLMQNITERFPIELKTDGTSSFILGRGSSTGIFDNTIGKEVVQISFEKATMIFRTMRATLLKDSFHCKVHVNGQPWPEDKRVTYLTSGDVISLDGLRYEYRLHITEISKDESSGANRPNPEETISVASSPSSLPNTRKAAIPSTVTKSNRVVSSASPTQDSILVPEGMASRLSDEIQCSVCLDIQVYPRTLDPCGHSFCAACVKDLKSCPQCRESIKSHVPAIQMDGLISMLVSVPKLLNKEDVDHYNERKKGNKVTPVVYYKKKGPAKRRRAERRAINLFDRDDMWGEYGPGHHLLRSVDDPMSSGVGPGADRFFFPAYASATSTPPTHSFHGRNPNPASRHSTRNTAFSVPRGSNQSSGSSQRHQHRTGTSSVNAISID